MRVKQIPSASCEIEIFALNDSSIWSAIMRSTSWAALALCDSVMIRFAFAYLCISLHIFAYLCILYLMIFDLEKACQPWCCKTHLVSSQARTSPTTSNLTTVCTKITKSHKLSLIWPMIEMLSPAHSWPLYPCSDMLPVLTASQSFQWSVHMPTTFCLLHSSEGKLYKARTPW